MSCRDSLGELRSEITVMVMELEPPLDDESMVVSLLLDLLQSWINPYFFTLEY